jgi:nucleoside-diphosphate-sugar epimerase
MVQGDVLKALEHSVELLAPLRGGCVVITGGTGFMGAWLAETLAVLNDSHSFGTRVVLLARSTDRFSLAYPHLAGRPDFSLVKSDVRHTIEVPKETTWVIHAAGNPDNRFHATSPVETMTVIADGTLAVLRAVDRCNDLRMFLHISSGQVQGPQPLEMERMPETFSGAPAVGSVSGAYAEAKRYAETLCSAARSQARIPMVIARPFAFLGPYQSLDSPFAIHNFIRDALAGGAIKVFGDGQTVRSYLYASDMAVWILRILVGGTSGLVYNIGSPDGVSLEAVARMVSDHFKPRPEIHMRTAAGAAQKSRLVPDVSRAVSDLGLIQTVQLDEAIAKTVAWNRTV